MVHGAGDDSDKWFRTQGGAGKVPFLGSQPIHYLFGWNRATGYGSGTSAAQVAKDWNGSGKTAIVTGATSGIGLETAKVLASRGCEVVIPARDKVRAAKAVAVIEAAVPGAKLLVLPADLSSLASVAAFAKAFLETGKPLHILVANAGIMAPPFALSSDGYESQWATNHLAHWLLVHLLLERIKATARQAPKDGGRIVTVTSYGHSFAPDTLDAASQALTLDALRSGVDYNAFGAYGISKLSNILFTRELAEVLKDEPVAVTVCHPGYIMDTNLSVHLLPGLRPAWLRQLLLGSVASFMSRLLGKDVPKGAATQTWLAVAPREDLVSGEYYACVNLETSSQMSHSRMLARQLWQASEQACAHVR